MPYDPSLPATNAALVSQVMRDQLQGLKALIDGVLTITAAQVDGVNTIGPGSPANVNVSVSGGTLHFTFEIPQGNNGSDGSSGTGVSSAVIDNVSTNDPNQGASANVSFDTGSSTLHFSFGIPRGEPGLTGDPGLQGPPFAGAVVDSVTTLDPGVPATVSVFFDGSNVRFSFGIPRGSDGSAGSQGMPGEVSNAQLTSAISGTSNNTNGVGTLVQNADSSYNPQQMQDVLNKMDELILSLRR